MGSLLCKHPSPKESVTSPSGWFLFYLPEEPIAAPHHYIWKWSQYPYIYIFQNMYWIQKPRDSPPFLVQEYYIGFSPFLQADYQANRSEMFPKYRPRSVGVSLRKDGYHFRFSMEKAGKTSDNNGQRAKECKKVQKSLVTSGFPENPVISFSVLRAKIPLEIFGFQEVFLYIRLFLTWKSWEWKRGNHCQNGLTHILTHTGSSHSGQSSIFCVLMTKKSRILRNFWNFLK